MKDLTILSTACGSMFMPGFFTCLKKNGERNIRIVGVDVVDDPMMGNFIDAYYKVPRINDINYVSELIKICIKESVDVFFPQISMELPIILSNIEEFKKINVKVAITDNDTLLIANNKYRLYEYMKKVNLVVPQYKLIDSVDNFESILNSLGYPQRPVCVKITESSGSRGVRIVRPFLSKKDYFMNQKPMSFDISFDEMLEILKEFDELPEIIAMEYLPGCEYTIDLLADHGKTLYICGRRNVESTMSIAMKSITEKKEEAYKLCEDIVRELKLDGNIGFDFMLDENDNPVLTDLNPRITATIILYLNAGLNFPYLRIKQLLGEELPDIDVKYGVKLKRRYLDMFE